MNLLTRLDRKLGRYAVHNLTMYLVAGQGTALLMGMGAPGFLNALLLVPQAVLGGEWWRLLTFIFTPPAGNPIFAIFALYLLYFMGSALEAHWGAFRYNVFVLIGLLMTIAAAFAFPYSVATNTYVTGSIFLAFAYLYPEYQIYMFLVLPIRIKWLALATWLFYGYEFAAGDWAGRLLILASVTNFFVFFGGSVYARVRYGHRELKRQSEAIASRNKALHSCAVCGITDKADRTMEFRYCTKCDPPVEYCIQHLGTHEHQGARPTLH